jgi:putative GTP pyrophosphokinase
MAERILVGEAKKIDALVNYYKTNQPLYKTFLDQVLSSLQNDSLLQGLIHSTKGRLKDPAHLKDKLQRKLLAAKASKELFDVTVENLFTKVNDLAGLRLLHLYTSQIAEIDQRLKAIVVQEGYELSEGPIAKTWDDDSRQLFSTLGIAAEKSPSMYTSVHYVIRANKRTPLTCEIQVRTLIEEVWGEVDHSINYPHPSASRSCRDQLKVLARMTSSCTRLVDSIRATHLEAK